MRREKYYFCVCGHSSWIYKPLTFSILKETSYFLLSVVLSLPITTTVLYNWKPYQLLNKRKPKDIKMVWRKKEKEKQECLKNLGFAKNCNLRSNILWHEKSLHHFIFRFLFNIYYLIIFLDTSQRQLESI